MRVRPVTAGQRPLRVTWGEVRDCHRPQDLVFTAEEVLDRTAELGDLLADLATTSAALPARSP
ncbi:hypothetical protein [Amycolatopsis anabasis]|uniref:hypothetical protein n=1 Tax=Amycolatopsis anabasis TaxID=1840409 RepID=UPI00131C4C72|nr:hypothetical protein [Amycolatopsis anabasis]